MGFRHTLGMPGPGIAAYPRADPQSTSARRRSGQWTRRLLVRAAAPACYGLGWVRPDRGMRWWYDSGKPTADRTLRLMADVWDVGGQLDWFAAWL